MARQFNPGNFRHKINFLSIKLGSDGKPARDDYGELTGEYDILKTVYASKEPILGNEYFSALTVESKVEVKFNCRYTSGITNEMRIQHGTEVYEILSAIDVKSLHRELLCYCRLVRE